MAWHNNNCESVVPDGHNATYPCDCGVPERIEALRAEIHTLPLAGSDIDDLLEMLEDAT